MSEISFENKIPPRIHTLSIQGREKKEFQHRQENVELEKKS